MYSASNGGGCAFCHMGEQVFGLVSGVTPANICSSVTFVTRLGLCRGYGGGQYMYMVFAWIHSFVLCHVGWWVGDCVWFSILAGGRGLGLWFKCLTFRVWGRLVTYTTATSLLSVL